MKSIKEELDVIYTLVKLTTKNVYIQIDVQDLFSFVFYYDEKTFEVIYDFNDYLKLKIVGNHKIILFFESAVEIMQREIIKVLNKILSGEYEI